MSDPRTTPANARVAHASLRSTQDVPRYTDGEVMRVAAPLADLHVSEDASRLDRQVVHGDAFRVLEIHDGRAFGINDRGGYVGYVAQDVLAAWTPPTHWVKVRNSFGFARADIKEPDPILLTMGARVAVTGTEGSFARTQDGTFIPALHLAEVGAPARDPVAQAELLVGTPYLWGGNSAQGIDCSGLVQASLIAAGIPCPGDADLQEATLGRPLAKDEALQRGDLIFWKGHVGIMSDAKTLLHANAHAMAVTFENFAEACERIEQQGGSGVTARKRIG